jgi:hypothetical protein
MLPYMLIVFVYGLATGIGITLVFSSKSVRQGFCKLFITGEEEE